MPAVNSIKKYFNDILGRASLEDIISAEIEKTTKEEDQCQHVIRMHQFQSHIAKARLAALIDWTRMEQQKAELAKLPTLTTFHDKEKDKT